MIFRFAFPFALVLLALPISIYLLNRAGWLRIRRTGLTYSQTALLPGLRSLRARIGHLPDTCLVAAWSLLVIGLARPQTGFAQEIVRGEGIHIVLVLDVSTSMAALDFAPQNRLESAKEVIAGFIQGRTFDQIGLVVFARDAFHLAPPTLDYPALLRLLSSVQLAPDLRIDDGTAIGLGLASAGNMLRDTSAPSRIVILLTDGSNNAGAVGPLSVADALATLGIRVYTIGIGESGLVPVPVDEVGNTRLVESDLDEETLRQIADRTGGAFFRAADLLDLRAVYSQIDILERSPVEREVSVRWQEQLNWALLPAVLLLLVERVLRLTILRVTP